MNVLNDEQLERMGLIKEIDTLKLIQSANLMKQRQQRKRLKVLMIIIVMCCILAQAIIIKWIGFNKEILILGGVYLLISSIILLMIRYKESENI